ncbi:MAG: MerR family transcriptional regulator [Longimicrobiales bacterium]
MDSENMHHEPRHPIRVAASRAGLTPEVLRAWERRYDVVSPARGDTGQRLYSDGDIDRLSMLARLSHGGRAVGRIAGISNGELERLLTEDADAHAARSPSTETHRDRAIAAARDLDGPALYAVLSRSVLSLGVLQFLEQVLVPVIEELGQEWHAGRVGIAREHTASVTIEQLLAWLIRELGTAPGAPRMLMATPSGERHALGSMIAAAAAVHDEWLVTWLGVDLPAEQIAAAAERDGAHAVTLGVVATCGCEAPRAEVEELRRLLPVRVPLLIGGSGASAFSELPGVTVIRDLQHWRAQIRRHSPTIRS